MTTKELLTARLASLSQCLTVTERDGDVNRREQLLLLIDECRRQLAELPE